MTILKYIPAEQNIIDYRGKNVGYYEATCDVCGTLFYPRRSDTKYCTAGCGLIAYRKALAAGTVKKKSKMVVKAPNSTQGDIITSKVAVIGFLAKQGVKTYGLMAAINRMKNIEDTIDFNGFIITRISTCKYQLFRL